MLKLAMASVIVGSKLTKKDVDTAREDYSEYIKITADIVKEVVIIGGEYHADAERILVEKFGSGKSDIWGGGYNITTKTFEVNAILNIKTGVNDSPDILNPDTRNRFLEVVKNKLEKISTFT